ncbi:hypothetical protein [Bacillus suaedaesalsae]|uniref:Uncharacterized protein n=1 Tax=Bacillus suaedaesalsae TaxID=2810349 RepID=A0ABS2DKZ6_9BACI|nr:hypothetical protein [Bacillus suaedaesalsae]MBM6619154.1 hypothetical protein [Bacillus suaedaesalsae]
MQLKEILLQDFTNKQKKNEIGFTLQTNLFQLLLSKYLQGIHTQDVEYLHVYCLGNLTEITYDSYTIENGLTVKIPYNPIQFLNLQSYEEKFSEYKRILDSFIAPVFLEKGWDYTPVTKALNEIKRHEGKLEFPLKGTPKKNPNRKYSAFVYGIHTITSFQLIGKILDKNGECLAEKLLVEEVPNANIYRRFLGQAKWIDNYNFQVFSKTSKWVETITIKKDD